jgi:hypothetical protein
VRRVLEKDDLKIGPTETLHDGVATVPTGQSPNTQFPALVADRAALLWWILFIYIVVSFVSFAIGYNSSSHEKGATEDADFWFLVQNTTMQLLGLIITALPGWRDGKLPKPRWVFPAAVAGISFILAIPLILVLPKEWSSLLCTVAGGLQTFMVLQHFVS